MLLGTPPAGRSCYLIMIFSFFLRLLVNQKKILTNIETVQLPRAPTRAGQAAGRPTRAAGQAACLLSARWGRRALAPGDPPPFFGNPLCYTSTCRTMRSKSFSEVTFHFVFLSFSSKSSKNTEEAERVRPLKHLVLTPKIS